MSTDFYNFLHSDKYMKTNMLDTDYALTAHKQHELVSTQ